MASFKTDESFLEKISIGVIGTQQVFSVLQRQGHKPIELERGSMNYKIWKKIKIKRIRVPDILCVDNGIRVESRAKTKLEISMSHSSSDPDRGWDFGMKETDYVAIVICEKNGSEPVDWIADNLVQFISIKALREAEKEQKVIFVKPKGAEEGFEARINWPACIATSKGEIIEIDKTIKYRTEEGRIKWVGLTKGGKRLSPLVKIGDNVKIEAARALGKLTSNYSNEILSAFNIATPNEMPGIAWALTKSNSINIYHFLDNLNSLEARQWISYIIGMQGEEKYISEIERLKNKDPEVYFAVTLLWKITTSWINGLKEY